MPATVEPGQRFTICVGIKCARLCTPDAWRVEIRDQAGDTVAAAETASDPLPGTEALCWTRVGLSAPEEAGHFEWSVVALQDQPVEPARAASGEEQTVVHASADAQFGFRVVPAADCRLRVVATRADDREPVAGARVVVHPYRAQTDRQGIAELALPKGPYRLFVSGPGFMPYRYAGELSADMTITAELAPDTGPTDAEIWS